MFFLDHIWLIPLLPAVRRGDHVLLWAASCRRQRSTRSASAWWCWRFSVRCGAVWQYTDYADDNHKPFEKIVYTWLGTDTGHLNYVKHSDGTRDISRPMPDSCLIRFPASGCCLSPASGMLIHIYSTGYMAHEGGYYRFFGYLNLFMFSMLTLILANNYVLMFVGWEGVGLCSYLLIGFYFHRKSASDAANKAFIVNRIGDAGFLLGMFIIAWYFGSLRFTDVNAAGAQRTLRHRRSDHHRRHAAAVRRRLRQVGAASALCLAARRHGRPDAGLAR